MGSTGCVLRGGNLPSARMHSALSIAGSDPTGGAGLQADLQVFRHFGVHAAAVPTALTIQDGSHVQRVLPVFPSVVLEQLRTTLSAVRPHAIKIGMLASDDVVRNVLLALAPLDPAVPVVIDPVLASSDGTPLLEKRAYGSLRDLAHGRRLLTPNWPEMEILVSADLPRKRDAEAAARELLDELVLDALLLKGGHREDDADDLFVTREGAGGGASVCEWLPGERLPGPPVHGTGCALSAAIAALLARGEGLREAVLSARAYVRRGIEQAHALANGARVLDFA
ncbi:MAG: hydroxymethylpyrimidine/phosphomethylpyrimidine kinase [Spirochaetaceae bacterium]|nr:hydroxymethylpyrimidine/phosphomethylpyrimidine kinase [Myxococcales bacterium]MCB9723416.1 hydroxymethylpyrimidine/phosphomethylpyrimidine kinase [Spirochaetaceae bacterium]